MLVTIQTQAQPLMIAHAGGGINGQDYTNSLEALELSYANGFRFFEIDFSWTSDNQLVCLHDWGKGFKEIFGFSTKQPLSYHEFQMQLYDASSFLPCTLDTLATWVIANPDVKIITDVKFDNIRAIRKIMAKHPKLKQQLIVQFYQPEEYVVFTQMGFKNLIWILYQYQGSLESVRKHAEKMKLYALSMRASQAKKRPMQKAQKKGTKLFVYTLNSKSHAKKMVDKYGVSGIYTDFLPADSEIIQF